MTPEYVKIALKMRDGSLAVMTFITRGAPNIDRKATPEAVDAEIVKTFGPGAVLRWHPIADADVPESREYRNAWTISDSGGTIEYDMGKARELHRSKLRVLREPLLAELDVETMKALETKDDARLTAAVVAKQALRDAPADPRIDAAQTIDELRAITLTARASSDSPARSPTRR